MDAAGSLTLEMAPGYDLLGEWLVADLWALGLGAYHQEVRRAVLRGRDGQSSEEILGNAFAVEVTGDTSTLRFLVRPEVDLRLATRDLLAAIDQVADLAHRGPA